MKIGIFADIHGNGPAFSRIFASLEKERCDVIFFLGDVCGYYYDQPEILERMEKTPHLISIMGNHDALFLQMLKDPRLKQDYTNKFGRSAEYLAESLSPSGIDYLSRCPMQYESEEFGMPIGAFHGSPWDPMNEYIYPNSDFRRFERLPYRLILLGHTHYPLDIRAGKLRIINPGSAGQPRSGGRPSYAVYETEKDRLKFKSVVYDAKVLLNDIQSRKETHSYLMDVIRRDKNAK